MKRAVAIALSLLIVLSLLCVPTCAAENEGLGFESTILYQGTKPLEQLPLTMEATIYLSRDNPEAYANGGTIFGNYTKYVSVDNMTFSVYTSGRPRITFVDDERHQETIIFNNVNVCTSEWVHLTLVFDPTLKQAHCYVNGELKETVSDLDITANVKIDNPSFLGGDLREDNTNYFKGRIKDVTLYSDMRTAEEIARDFQTKNPDQDNLLAAYTLSESNHKQDIHDLSPNGYDLDCDSVWVSPEPVEDYAYAFAVVGDTQYQCKNFPETYTGLYDWLIENKEKHKIELVMGMGDITDSSSDLEWERAKKEIHRLDKVVPHTFVRGNHDEAASFEKAFPYSECKNLVDGAYNNSMLNTYKTLTVGKHKYLIVNLEYNTLTTTLDWASEVIQSHPDHQVIVTTHSYLYGVDTETEMNSEGVKFWDNLVKKHENIVLVLCGHSGGDSIRRVQSVGEKGNVVTQLMINAQYKDTTYDGVGIIGLLYFSEDGKDVQVRYYSTAKNTYFRDENQFRFELAPKHQSVQVAFNDVKDHWGKDYILPLAEKGIVKGKSTTSFEPDSNITRAEFLTLALKVAGIAEVKGQSYSDVAMSAWFGPTVATAMKMGLIDDNMVKEDHFFPDQNITREEMTSIIVKLYESQKNATGAGNVSVFTDHATFSPWATDSIGKAVALGVVAGNPDGTFNALGNATRAEAAVIFSRLLKLL